MGSASTALRALELIAAHQPLGLSELARKLGVSKPSGQRAIDSLAADCWIRRSDTQPGRWVLTPKVLDLAGGVGRDTGLRDAARPVMVELARSTTESVHLAILDGSEIVVIDEVESTQIIRIHWPVGQRSATHASANGKAMLALLTDEDLAAHLPTKLNPFTPETITHTDELCAELWLTAQRGYAVQRGELRSDVAAIAAAITTNERPVGAIGLFMPIQRLQAGDEQRLGALVREAAATVSAKLAEWRSKTA